ncbi:MAG: bifunctional folylpolyglutamate synthase/dihydrofolate synthase [Acidobacteria bacterium]|nr:bifunctional folylpolyglutamate synthase/dihydrofolate synthase [Acidobacteriota bacterium]
MDYAGATRYLISLGNEIRASASDTVQKLGLGNITELLEDLERPQEAYRSILVAGTNGKGSVAAMLDAVLRAAGLRSGLYTSPHLVEINERIRVGGHPIPPAEFAELFSFLRSRIERLLAAGRLRYHPTYFECLTAMGMEYFRRRKCDLAVLEVGMGGRLDATNISAACVSLLTEIDFDHERFLGNTIAAIASEKAGVIKPGAVVVSAASHPAAAEVIRARAREQGARLVEVGKEYCAKEVFRHEGQYSFLACANDAPSLPVKLSLRGRHQVENALAAVAGARELARLGFPVSDADIQQGLASAEWPGRLELFRERPRVFLDGAHNPSAARALVRFWEENFPSRRLILVYGAMRDKAVQEIMEILFPKVSAVVLTRPEQFRAAAPETLRELSSHLSRNLVIEPAPAAALEAALAMASDEDVIFVTGSLFLVGDIKRLCAPEAGGTDPLREQPLLVPSGNR